MPPSPSGQPEPSRPANGGGKREGTPAILTSTPNAASLLRALQRRWLLGLALGLVLGGSAATGVWLLLPPPKATVRTVLRLPQGSYLSGEPARNPESYQRTQAALVKSRMVLARALRDPEVAKLPAVASQPGDLVEWLEKEVQADFSVAPDILRISMQGHNPDELVVLVNAIRKAYLKEVVEKEKGAGQERLAWLKEQRERFEARLQEAQKLQRDVEEKAGGRDAGLRARILSFLQQSLGMAEHELLRTRWELTRAKAELTTLQARENNRAGVVVPKPVVDAALAKDRTLLEMEAEANRIEKLIERTLERSRLKEKDPDVRRLRFDLATVNAQITLRKRNQRKPLADRLREEARGDLSKAIASVQGRIDHLTDLEGQLKDEVKKQREELAQKTKHGIRVDEFKENLSQVETWARRLGEQELKLKLELQAPTGVDVLEESGISRVNAERRQMTMAGLAGLAGLGLALFGVSWLEYRARRVDSAEEVVDGLGMRLLGTLPDAARVSRRLARGKEPLAHNLLTESVDSCRAMLLHMAREEGLRVVLVTSAVSGEGKTSLVSHLAASMARAGLRTLLVDADLRNPSAHRVFSLPNTAGFSEVLRGEAEVSQVTHPTPIPALSVLPAGRWDAKTIQALVQGGAAVLAGLRPQYDFILVDSSPVLPVADALLVGRHTDGVLLSVLRHVSRMPNVFTASQRIESLGQRVLGVVVNGVGGQGYSGSYPYYLSPPEPKAEPAEAPPEGQQD